MFSAMNGQRRNYPQGALVRMPAVSKDASNWSFNCSYSWLQCPERRVRASIIGRFFLLRKGWKRVEESWMRDRYQVSFTFRAISDYFENFKKAPSFIVPICYRQHRDFSSQPERLSIGVTVWIWNRWIRRRFPIGSVVFWDFWGMRALRWIATATVIILWSTFSNYEHQNDSFSCWFFVIAAISDFAPNNSHMPHVIYRKYRFKKTCMLRDSAACVLQ